MQFDFRFQILLFSTSVRFSTKTLAYLAYKAYKAFMAFKRSRLNTRTIRLVYASLSILSVCKIKFQVIVNQKNHHQENTRDQHVNTFTLIWSQLVVMVLRGQLTTGYYCAICPFCGGGKKKTIKNQRRFYSFSNKAYWTARFFGVCSRVKCTTLSRQTVALLHSQSW